MKIIKAGLFYEVKDNNYNAILVPASDQWPNINKLSTYVGTGSVEVRIPAQWRVFI